MRDTVEFPTSGLPEEAASGLHGKKGAHLSVRERAAGMVAVLAGGLRDPADKVRRRVAATLGELLFYVAMQPPVCAHGPSPGLLVIAGPILMQMCSQHEVHGV